MMAATFSLNSSSNALPFFRWSMTILPICGREFFFLLFQFKELLFLVLYSVHGLFASYDDIVRVIGWRICAKIARPVSAVCSFSERGISPLAIFFYRKKQGRFGIFSPFSGQCIPDFLRIPDRRISQFFYLTPHATSFTWGLCDN